MELIPILATIILMATISTFFLAVGAYVLYKIRERKGVRIEKAAPSTIQAELVTPEVIQEIVQQTAEAPARAPVRAFERPNPPAYRPSNEPIFVQSRTPQPAAPVFAQEAPKAGPAQVQAPAAAERKTMKVTNEGLATQKEEKKQGAVKWR